MRTAVVPRLRERLRRFYVFCAHVRRRTRRLVGGRHERLAADNRDGFIMRDLQAGDHAGSYLLDMAHGLSGIADNRSVCSADGCDVLFDLAYTQVYRSPIHVYHHPQLELRSVRSSTSRCKHRCNNPFSGAALPYPCAPLLLASSQSHRL